MLLLALDTSTPNVTVAVADVRDGTPPHLLAECADVAPNRHGELLAPLIEQALATAQVAPRELTAVAVGLGPGPFTGLRVGIVSAAATGHALRIPTYGVCSLDVVAKGIDAAAPFAVVTDARRKELYWATYDASGRRTSGPSVDTPGAVRSALGEEVQTVVGPGVELYPDVFAGLQTQPVPPTARAVVALVADRVVANALSEVLTPIYLRRPDAAEPRPPKPVLVR
ncbi:MAG: tRNA (adenosine(37)-N6)-threonylcarbamoyltransferase complex dimerization subunit type 1 TsaB [Mycobacteriales bacterium]|nr:tRNA (adenosine(37)-N6)-threonylcarbamoyltransferase complex dimerization subunit type 1 TsaB [Frankia sp.]